jgi:uncharacterized protein involved in exopolysaccharide biosynthesis
MIETIEEQINKDELDLHKILNDLWESKVSILSITAVFALLSIIYALSITPEYRSQATLVRAENSNVSMPSSISALGGIASSFGIDLGSSAVDDSQIAFEIAESWGFIEEFININDLSPVLFAAESWDSETGQLIYNENIYNTKKKKWVSSEPSSFKKFELFSEKLNMTYDPLSSLYRISIDSYSPKLAKDWTDLFVVSINNHMRTRKLNQVNLYIDFLEQQIAKTSITGMKEVFYKIIEEQVKTKMLAQANPEYVFTIASKPMIPELRFKPRRSLMVILGTLLGSLVSVLFFIIRSRITN